jgi:proteasome lid subunit RPN8/RPN11
MLQLTLSAQQTIANQAAAEYPNECVGLLLGQIDGENKIASVAYPVENRWEGQVTLAETDKPDSRRDRFYLDPRDYLKADRAARAQGLDIVGCYHSHPDWPAEPSERDRVGAQGIGGGSSFAFVIQSVREGQATDLRSWLLSNDGSQFIQEDVQIIG